MLGKIIDMNNTDAFITFQNGTTKNVSKLSLSSNAKIGDTVNIDPNAMRLTNDKLVDFF
ncbi:hypothetical protein BD780_003971 [Clostridium tetanomorphum]|uniref:Uncharacterized protein n=1 Tax=Clostridium tetanomorphum TaxID=1553 RepID=A0A923EA71_CLOTT|nr:hypothetical protein [Clostridium tetanomorphum]KAJ49859.1 hypothetical protein CTM_20911 [Clostridium tetanomorphum DSM 665]MBC2399313.1 hypothetical protein [Clostridium tetanomorphum]MBP1866118.1 hypothetical protein [Clostridium tetanomorphum]NRS86746.1 hypothetical protein [Clostridium tetanomorphum]NRZ99501.1 hypothetical protein [Clostridium tetanomorphum]